MLLEIAMTLSRPEMDFEIGVTGTVNGQYGQIEEVIIEGTTCHCCGKPMVLSAEDEKQIEDALIDAAIAADEDARERALDRKGDR